MISYIISIIKFLTSYKPLGDSSDMFARALLQKLYQPIEPVIYLKHDGKNKSADKTVTFALFSLIRWLNRKPYVRLRWYFGSTIQLPLHSKMTDSIVYHGTYEPHEFYILQKLLLPGECFIDIGAHVGTYTLYAASLVGPGGKVISFEPSAREFEYLTHNSKLSQTELHQQALSNKTGTVILQIAKETHSGMNAIKRFLYKDTPKLAEKIVSAIRLDDFLKKRPDIGQVNLIKIDVEGHELAVLHGSVKTLKNIKPILLIEVTNFATLKFLQCFGYHCYLLAGFPPILRAIRTKKNFPNYITVNILASPYPLSFKL
jgi:FkbM family methyltransferase